MFSSLNSYVSPKAWLASYLAKNLAEWLQVDPSTIESNLFQDARIRLQNVGIRSGGSIDLVELRWTWTSSSITDVTLHISGAQVIVSREKVDHLSVNQQQHPVSPPTGPTSDTSWTAKYFQQIMDHLTVVINDVCVLVQVDEETSLKVAIERAELKTLGSIDSKLDQSLEMSGFQASVVKQNGAEYPLMDSWGGKARVQRIAGRRFVDGVLTGLLVAGYQEMSPNIRVHAGPVQLEALLKIQDVWMKETGVDTNVDMEVADTKVDASQLKLPLKSIGIMLENGMVVAFEECELRYSFDGSVFFVVCSGGLCFDEETQVVYSKQPLLLDLKNQRMGILQESGGTHSGFSTSTEADISPDVKIEVDVFHLQRIMQGVKGTLSVVRRAAGQSPKKSHTVNKTCDNKQEQTFWTMDTMNSIVLTCNGGQGKLNVHISGLKATVGEIHCNMSWEKITYSMKGIQATFSAGALDPFGLRFETEVSVRIDDELSSIAETLASTSAEMQEIFSIHGTDDQSRDSLALPFSMLIPSVQVSSGGQYPFSASFGKVDIGTDLSITCASLSARGLGMDASVRANSVRLSILGECAGSLVMNIAELTAPGMGELVKPLNDVKIELDGNVLAVGIPGTLKAGLSDLENTSSSSARHKPEIPFDIRVAVGTLALFRKFPSCEPLAWKSAEIKDLLIDVSQSLPSTNKVAASFAYSNARLVSAENFELVGKAQTFTVEAAVSPLWMVSVNGTVSCGVRTPSERLMSIEVVCPEVAQVPVQAAKKNQLPFRFDCAMLKAVYTCVETVEVSVSNCSTSRDGRELSISETNVKISSLDVIAPLQLLYDEFSTLITPSGQPTGGEMLGLPMELRMEFCSVTVADQGDRFTIKKLEAHGRNCILEELEVDGFYESGLVIVKSFALTIDPSSQGLILKSSFCVDERSKCNLFNLAAPIDEVSVSFQSNLLSIVAPAIVLNVIKDMNEHSDQEGKEAMATLPFQCSFSTQRLQLRNTPPQGQMDTDLWHSMLIERFCLLLNPSQSLKEVQLGCEKFVFDRLGLLPVAAEVDGMELHSKFSPQWEPLTSRLWVPGMGELALFRLKVGVLRRLTVAGSGTLVAPIQDLSVVLQDGVIFGTTSNVEWKMDAPKANQPPGQIAYVPPFPAHLHLDRCSFLSTLSNGKVIKLTSCEQVVVRVEPLPGLRHVKTEITKASNLTYLEIVHVPNFSASAVLHAECLDIFSKAVVELETARIRADFVSADWAEALEDNAASQLYQLPNVIVSPVEIELNFQGKIASVEEATVKFGAFSGQRDTNSSSLAAHYIKQVKKRIPYFLSKTNILGTNVGDSASSMAAGMVLRSTVGGSVLGVAGRDAIGSAISLGKSQRGATETERYKFGDLSRGLASSIGEAAKTGTSLRNDTNYQVGDVTSGTVSAASKYASNNRVRLSAAGGSGVGMTAGLVLAGPVGLIAGAVIGGRAAASVVTGLSGDPKKKSAQSAASQDGPPDLMNWEGNSGVGSEQSSSFANSSISQTTAATAVDPFSVFESSTDTAPPEHSPSHTQPSSSERTLTPAVDPFSIFEESPTNAAPSSQHPPSVSSGHTISRTQTSPPSIGFPQSVHHSGTRNMESLQRSAPENQTNSRVTQSPPYSAQGYQNQHPASSQYSRSVPPLPSASASGQAKGYQFGDLTRSVVSKGKEKRGKDSNSGYKFGDFTRGLFG